MTTEYYDRRNSQGLIRGWHTGELERPTIYFPDFVDETLDLVDQQKNLLIEGEPGVGKSHLAHDLVIAGSEAGLVTGGIVTHINGGSKRGVSNALDFFDQLRQRSSGNGLLVVDNIDFFGYSGNSGKRGYGLAEAHLTVAREIKSMVDDPDDLTVVGVGHTSLWRIHHWGFGERRGDQEDAITPVITDLLLAFDEIRDFEGIISAGVAKHLLRRRHPEISCEAATDIVEQVHELVGRLTFKHLYHLDPAAPSVQSEIDRIEEGSLERHIPKAHRKQPISSTAQA